MHTAFGNLLFFALKEFSQKMEMLKILSISVFWGLPVLFFERGNAIMRGK